MGFLIRTLKKIWVFIVEGGTFTVLFPKVWKKFWSTVDLILSIIPRLILKYTTKIDDRKVFFYTQENAYTCNPKYICEELLKRNEKVHIVWRGTRTLTSIFPEKVKVVPFNKYDYFKEIYSAKVVITNSSLFLNVPVFLKKQQYLLETWHGSLGLKKWGKEDIKDSLVRIFAFEQTARMTDFLISNSKLENGSMRSTYWPDTPILEYGHARNDIFFDNYKDKRKELKQKICAEYNIPEDTKIVMYAPTFRDWVKDLSYLNVDYSKVLKALTKRFKGNWVFFVRLHPSLKPRAKELGLAKNPQVINVTEYPDMQELAAITDIAITDYSSWIYDFILSRKPGFLFATDLDEYQKKDRGFYYPITETPFAICRTNDELIRSIETFNKKEYLEKLEAFLDDKGCFDDGKASERVADKILELLKTPKK
ncbi:MAG: CDP-glycerol glycerophosphotransferase family protein [Erysipelotrichaceae bacterium]|nr:CDP-glycerol glycerophosphotransferase family protein [Erysipelotrichaceae bacterium]